MPLSKELAKELFLKYAKWLKTGVKETSSEDMRKLLAQSYKVSEEEMDEVIRKGWQEALRQHPEERRIMEALHKAKPTLKAKIKIPGTFKREAGEVVQPGLTGLELKQAAKPEEANPLLQVVRQVAKIKSAPSGEAPEVLSRVYDRELKIISNFPKEKAKELIESGIQFGEKPRYIPLPAPRGVEGAKLEPATGISKRVMDLYGYQPFKETPVKYERAIPVPKVEQAYLKKELKQVGMQSEDIKPEWVNLWQSESEKSWWKTAMEHGLGRKKIGEEKPSARAFFMKMMKMSEEAHDEMAAHPVNKRFLNRINVLKKALPVAGGTALGIEELYEPEEAKAGGKKEVSEFMLKRIGDLRKQVKGIIEYKPTIEELAKGLEEGKLTKEQIPERLKKFFPTAVGVAGLPEVSSESKSPLSSLLEQLSSTKSQPTPKTELIKSPPLTEHSFIYEGVPWPMKLTPVGQPDEGLRVDPISALSEAASVGPQAVGRLAGAKIGTIASKVTGLYGEGTEATWQTARKLFYKIPLMEKAFKTNLTKMEEGGMQKAAGLFRKRLTKIGVKEAELREFSQKMYQGLSLEEEAFASSVMKGVDVPKAAKEWGVGGYRAMEIDENFVRPLREMFKEKGWEAVTQNLLKESKYKENIQKYLPRMYWTKEMAKVLDTPGLKPIPLNVRLDLRRFMKRSNIPEEVRMALEEINQLSYLTYKGLTQITHDVETMKLFRGIAQNPKWVQPITKKGLNALNEMGLSSEIGKDFVLMPRGKGLGPLSGKLVRKEIAGEINEVLRVANPFEKAYMQYFLTPWKFGKTVLRVSTHARNVMSNFILNDFGGLAPYRLDVYGRALKELIGKEGSYYKQALKEGLLAPTYAASELGPFARGIPRKTAGNMLEEGWKVVSKYPKKGITGMSNTYQAEEQWFKLAKFMHNVDKGMPYKDAAKDAMKWTFNYSEITPFIRKAKTWAMPFATFTYKALPIVAETAIKHPLKLAKYPLGAIALTSYSLQKMGFNSSDWERLKKDLPMYMRRGHFMLLPFKDEQNRLQFMDLTYIWPWGDIGEMAQQGWTRFLQNPVLQLYAQLSQNKDYSGKPIWHEWEEPMAKGLKFFKHIYSQLMPTGVPGGVDWNTIYNAMSGELQKKEALNTKQAFLQAFAGMKIRPIVEEERHKKMKGLERQQKAEMRTEMRRQLRETTSPEKRSKARKEYRENLKRLYGPKESLIGKLGGSPAEWAQP